MLATTASIAFVVGTRPEAIKLAPVILQARQRRCPWRAIVISTGQQADLVAPSLNAFALKPDIELHVMRPGQSLNSLLAQCLTELSTVLRTLSPDLVVVQGDTTTAMAGAIVAFHERLPVAHIEAGLRTGDLKAPFPEEANRQIISRLAQLHFAATVDAKARLLSEGIDAGRIEVTGNTIVDALALLTPAIRTAALPDGMINDRRVVLVTAHRRENLGKPLGSICDAVRQLASGCQELEFIVIKHPNPVAARIVHEKLAGRKRITLLPPLTYLEMLKLLSTVWLVLTDSGGIQEEAPSFGKPVLVLRDNTERVEGLALGYAKLIGTQSARIISEVTELLQSSEAYEKLIPADNPYGDGNASERI